MAPKISLEGIRRDLKIPNDIELGWFAPSSIPQSGDLIISVKQLACVRLPLHPLFNIFFNKIGIRPNQLNPNGFRILSGVCALNSINEEITIDIDDLHYFYKIVPRLIRDQNTYHFHARHNALFSGAKDYEKDWSVNLLRVSGAWSSTLPDCPPIPIVEGNACVIHPTEDNDRIIKLLNVTKFGYNNLELLGLKAGLDLVGLIRPTNLLDFFVPDPQRTEFKRWYAKNAEECLHIKKKKKRLKNETTSIGIDLDPLPPMEEPISNTPSSGVAPSNFLLLEPDFIWDDQYLGMWTDENMDKEDLCSSLETDPNQSDSSMECATQAVPMPESSSDPVPHCDRFSLDQIFTKAKESFNLENHWTSRYRELASKYDAVFEVQNYFLRSTVDKLMQTEAHLQSLISAQSDQIRALKDHSIAQSKEIHALKDLNIAQSAEINALKYQNIAQSIEINSLNSQILALKNQIQASRVGLMVEERGLNSEIPTTVPTGVRLTLEDFLRRGVKIHDPCAKSDCLLSDQSTWSSNLHGALGERIAQVSGAQNLSEAHENPEDLGLCQ